MRKGIGATVEKITSAPAWEYLMGFLALIASAALILQHSELGKDHAVALQWVDDTVLGIFTFDYFARFYLADNKWSFFKSNIIELIAIIPFSTFFQSLRLLRLVRLFVLFQYVARRFDRHRVENSVTYGLLIFIALVCSGAGGVLMFEKGHNPNIRDFGDALWWSLVTITTVGYGDISPVTVEGRMLAGLLMITGIGVIGTVTASLSALFIRRPKKREESFSDETIQLISDQLNQLETLDERDFENLQAMLHRAWRKKREEALGVHNDGKEAKAAALLNAPNAPMTQVTPCGGCLLPKEQVDFTEIQRNSG
ncbi:ion channel, putative [Heliomicrobium modesticaldum Ice1]|uniref:Ion channel, putative n=1 Tax=Heliobacterium modesticaldum (strain ATCC 51547 / Ice1) TaxID=498761 RepID=B0TIC7_HELMI|nr:ion transporter [Heliomicrobium modesticaldum]ABZ83547.1 ion channel, putative [Heliomicrobium modesticaldum Ice1]